MSPCEADGGCPAGSQCYEREITRTLTVKVSSQLSARVVRMAKREKTTQSELIRRALEAYAFRGGLTFGEMAAKYIGSARGPGDLATNKKYFDGFGE